MAIDLFSQAEHDELAQSVMITTSASFIKAVKNSMSKLISSLPRKKIILESLNNRGMFIKAKNNNEICEYINAKSLKFLSIDGMYRAMGFEKRNSTYPQLTDHYFTGDYPVKPIDNLGDDKVTQLSLLSTASNN